MSFLEIYQHFREEERPFIDAVLDWKDLVFERQQIKRTDFLDPRQQDILLSLIGKNEDIEVSFSGGFSCAERKRAILFPTYFSIQDEDYQLVGLTATYPNKFTSLSHRDVLGALMSLGLKREKYGDISLVDDRIQVIVAEEVADYIRLHLTSIGRTTIEFKTIALSDCVVSAEEWSESQGTVSSLRLDVVLSEIYHQSRSHVAEWIESGAVKVNWKKVEKPSFEVQSGDYLSLRGFGRSKLISLEGETKKGKHRITYGVLK